MKMTLNFKMFLKVDFIFISGGTTFASGTTRGVCVIEVG